MSGIWSRLTVHPMPMPTEEEVSAYLTNTIGLSEAQAKRFLIEVGCYMKFINDLVWELLPNGQYAFSQSSSDDNTPFMSFAVGIVDMFMKTTLSSTNRFLLQLSSLKEYTIGKKGPILDKVEDKDFEGEQAVKLNARCSSKRMKHFSFLTLTMYRFFFFSCHQ